MGKTRDSITVVIADDHELAREGVRKLLARAPDIVIVEEAEDGERARRLVSNLHPHILLLDLVMPGPPSVETALWAEQQPPPTHVLVLTGHDHDYFLAEMVKSGVAGYLDKSVRAQQLIGSIRNAAMGETCFTLEQLKRVREWQASVLSLWEGLTPRE